MLEKTVPCVPEALSCACDTEEKEEVNMPGASISNGFTGCLKKISRKCREIHLSLVVLAKGTKKTKK